MRAMVRREAAGRAERGVCVVRREESCGQV